MLLRELRPSTACTQCWHAPHACVRYLGACSRPSTSDKLRAPHVHATCETFCFHLNVNRCSHLKIKRCSLDKPPTQRERGARLRLALAARQHGQRDVRGEHAIAQRVGHARDYRVLLLRGERHDLHRP